MSGYERNGASFSNVFDTGISCDVLFRRKAVWEKCEMRSVSDMASSEMQGCTACSRSLIVRSSKNKPIGGAKSLFSNFGCLHLVDILKSTMPVIFLVRAT